VLAAYLVSTGLEPADAVEGVRSVRPGSVESVAQEHAVHRYAEAAGKAGEDR
jgi:hypothetical protein